MHGPDEGAPCSPSGCKIETNGWSPALRSKEETYLKELFHVHASFPIQRPGTQTQKSKLKISEVAGGGEAWDVLPPWPRTLLRMGGSLRTPRMGVSASHEVSAHRWKSGHLLRRLAETAEEESTVLLVFQPGMWLCLAPEMPKNCWCLQKLLKTSLKT